MKRRHRDLRAWQEAVSLVEAAYVFVRPFPRSEQFGLAGQIQRAAVSVPTNIAEGAARSTTKELIYFLSVANGSLSELDTLVTLANRIGYAKDISAIRDQIDEVSGLVMGMIAALKRRRAA